MNPHSISKKTEWLWVKNYFAADAPVELLIQGPIGGSWFDDSGTTEKAFTDALAEIPEGKEIVVGINSEGGAVKDGLGIYHALRRRGDKVTTRIDGYAVSIASVIALAGAKRISPESSIWMIHEPWSMVAGDAETMRKEAKALDTHAEAIRAVYAERTKLKPEDCRDKMKAETWFRGAEAVEMGFATETNGDPVALNAVDFTKFRNVPKDILSSTFAAVAKGAKETTPTDQPATHTASAANVQAPTTEGNPPVTATAQISGQVAGSTNQQPKGNSMDTTTQAATAATPAATTTANAPAPVAPAAPDTSAQILDLQSQINALRNPPIVAARASVTREGLKDLLAAKGNAAARYSFMIQNWQDLRQSFPLLPQNANTDTAAGTLTPALLSDGTITVAQSKLASLKAFLVNFTAGRVKRNVIEVPKVTAGGTARSNDTDFQDTSDFVASVDDIPITPAHITAGAQLTSAEMQNGWRMDWFVRIKNAEFAQKIQALVNAIITTGNFGTAAFTGSATAFKSENGLATCWAAVKDAAIKNIILDGEYFAKFLPLNQQDFNPMGGAWPGWDGFYNNNYWTGATANTVGFVGDPSAISGAIGLPLETPDPFTGLNPETIITLPDTGMQISSRLSWSSSSRTVFWTLEAMAGFAAGDTTAGDLIASA